MKKLNKTLITILLWLCTPIAFAWQLQPFQATYVASISGVPINGQAQYQLTQHQDKTWELKTVASMMIITRAEDVLFKIEKDQIKPLNYKFTQSGLKSQQATIAFNWKSSLATSHDSKRGDGYFSLKYNILDQLSSQLALQQDIANGKKQVTYKIISKNKLKDYAFKVLNEETIETPVGKIKTIKVTKLHGSDNRRKTYFWLAKDWNYTLVRFYQREKDGKEYIISLSNGKVNGKEIKGL